MSEIAENDVVVRLADSLTAAFTARATPTELRLAKLERATSPRKIAEAVMTGVRAYADPALSTLEARIEAKASVEPSVTINVAAQPAVGYLVTVTRRSREGFIEEFTVMPAQVIDQ